MIQFGRFIRTVENLQAPSPLFFLAENVVVSGKDLDAVKDAFGFDWDPITLDALYLSPTRRNRMFVTNIIYSDIDYNSELSLMGPESCLEEGFVVPTHVLTIHVTAKV
jgi:hypothetical protein